MTTKRQRLTQKEAAAPPATPGYAEYFSDDPHPAAQDDPNMHEYEIGGPSEFAEDPHPGPYVNSERPATPWEGSDHPANKKAREMRASIERKAAKCVRAAQQMLGKEASPAQIEDQALDLMDMADTQINTTLKRLGGDFMAEDEDEEKEGHDVFDVYDLDADDLISPDEWGGSDEVFEVMDADGDGMLDVEEVGTGLGPEFSRFAAAMTDEIKALRTEVTGLKSAVDMDQNDPDAFYGMDEMGNDDLLGEEDPDAEQMLAQMLAEEDNGGDAEEAMLAQMLAEEDNGGDAEEAMLAQMLAEEDNGGDAEEATLAQMLADAEKPAQEEEEACDACGPDAQLENIEFEEEVEEAPLLAAEEDPMGLMEEIIEDDSVLAQLYGGRMAAKKGEDDEDDKDKGDEDGGDEGDDNGDDEADETSDNDDEDGDDKDKDKDKDEKEGKKKAAARKPRPRTASTNIKTVGAVHTASSPNEIDDLSRLWDSAPDVTDHFK